MFDAIKNMGGMKGLMDLVTNPDKLPSMIVSTMPGCTQTIARLRLLSDMARFSGNMQANCVALLTMCMMQKRDVTQQELNHLIKDQGMLIHYAVMLSKLPDSVGGLSYENFLQVNGVPQGNARPEQTHGNPGNTADSNGGIRAT